MKISSIQITRKTEEIIKKYLYAGQYPSYRTITKELANWLRDIELGAPSFSHRSVHKKEVTSPDKYNKNFKEIEQDIKDIYAATIYQYNVSMRNHSKFEADRSMLRHELQNLKDEIDEVLVSTKETDIKYVKEKIVGFSDLSKVDLSKSDCLIDAEKKIVTLKEKDLQSNRVIIPPEVPYRVEVYSSHLKSEVVEPVSNAFDDKINTRWWHIIRTKELNINNKMEIALVIDLGKKEGVNNIHFEPHHTREMYLSVEYSNNGTSFTPVESFTDIKVSESLDFSFPVTKARYLKFRMTKYEYEDRFGDTYNYTFGAKNIKIFKKVYEEESVLETKELTLPLNSKRVSLLMQDSKPAGTDIEYYVCLNPDPVKENEIWHRVSSMNNEEDSYAKSLLLNPNRRDTMTFIEAKYDEKTVNGMRSYKLIDTKGKSYIHTIGPDGEPLIEDIEDPKLYRGIDQIRRESLYVPFQGQVPLLSHWERYESEKKNVMKLDYFSKRNELPFRSGKDNMYRFSFSIYSESSRTVPLSVNNVFKILKKNILKVGLFSIYANKERLPVSNDEVTIEMKQGWTEIQILIHLGNVLDRTDFTDNEEKPRNITLGKFNLTQEKMFRGDLQPLRLTDKDNLYRNIAPHNKDYFAIKDREIFLNYDSKETRFYLVYNQKKRIDVTSYIKIRAKLKREKHITEITPKIHKIRIRTM